MKYQSSIRFNWGDMTKRFLWKERQRNFRYSLRCMEGGTVLSALALQREEYLVDGVVAWGQILNRLFFNEEVMEELRSSKIPKSKLEEIEKIKTDAIDVKQLMLMVKAIQAYTEGYTNKHGMKTPMISIVLGLLNSRITRSRISWP